MLHEEVVSTGNTKPLNVNELSIYWEIRGWQVPY